MEIYVNRIPEFQQSELSDLAISLTKTVFQNPDEEEKYQRWLKERRSKIANTQ